MKEFIINQNDSGQRIDKFIMKAMPEMPKSMMYKLIRKKDIKLNGKRCDIDTRLTEGDIVRVYVKDDVSGEKQHDMSFLNASDNIEIVFEDNNIIVAYKPVGVDSHSNDTGSADTMINRIKHYLYKKGEYIPQNENSFAPALCSRLDRNTSGLITAAKNSTALREINSAIRDGNINKKYRCIVTKKPPKNSDILTAWHYRDEGRNIVRISDEEKDGYKQIKTGYEIIGEIKRMYILEITLYTGRTHQIRAHLAHIGCPVLGDGKYGDISINKRYGVFRQNLCAYALEFNLPEDSVLHYMNDKEIKLPEKLLTFSV